MAGLTQGSEASYNTRSTSGHSHLPTRNSSAYSPWMLYRHSILLAPICKLDPNGGLPTRESLEQHSSQEGEISRRCWKYYDWMIRLEGLIKEEREEQQRLTNTQIQTYKRHLVIIRLLAYFIILSPHKDKVVDEIGAAIDLHDREPEASRKVILVLGAMYFDTIKTFCVQPNTKSTPQNIGTPDAQMEYVQRLARDLQPATQTYEPLKRSVGRRENYQCPITKEVHDGIEDLGGSHIPDPQQISRYGTNGLVCAHIFPQKLGKSSNANVRLAIAWKYEVFHRCFGLPQDIINTLTTGPERIHNPINAMFISPQPHSDFDKLKFWLEELPELPIPTGNVSTKVSSLDIDIRGTMSCSMPTPPSPHLLRCHALACRMACLSGAADIFQLDGNDPDEDVDPISTITWPIVGTTVEYIEQRCQNSAATFLAPGGIMGGLFPGGSLSTSRSSSSLVSLMT